MKSTLLLSTAGLYTLIAIGAIFIIMLALIIGIVPMNVWLRSWVSGARVSMMRLVGMKLRHVEVNMLINNYINAKKAGVKLTIDDLETHFMAGGNVNKVVDALIAAHGAKINLSVATAKAIDLANRDVLLAVKSCVNPMVITTPLISAVAKDGIELKVRARITVKTNINMLIGGAGEDTILARVGEGIVTAVGSAETHGEVLEKPESISKLVHSRGLDLGTSFEIVSIDIADVDVGRNIGAKLQAERAEADMQIAQAKAEERRSMAIAVEQEMRAETQKKRAKLIDAESEVPLAISVAFKEGQLGVLDYYRMQNIVADTSMRKALAGPSVKDKGMLLNDKEDRSGGKK